MSDRIPRGATTTLKPRPQLLIFDLDNTLADHAKSLRIRLHHAFETLIPNTEQRENVVQESIDHATDGTAHFADLLTSFGLDDEEAHTLACERYISDRYRGLDLYDDVLASIDAVKQVATVGMITNGPTDIQQPKLDLLEVEHHFSFVLISESVGIWKPDPGIFEMALEIAETQAEDAAYVGDSPDHDIAGAHAAGLTAIWINRAGIEWPGGQVPDLEVRDLDELLISLGVSDSAA